MKKLRIYKKVYKLLSVIGSHKLQANRMVPVFDRRETGKLFVSDISRHICEWSCRRNQRPWPWGENFRIYAVICKRHRFYCKVRKGPTYNARQDAWLMQAMAGACEYGQIQSNAFQNKSNKAQWLHVQNMWKHFRNSWKIKVFRCIHVQKAGLHV